MNTSNFDNTIQELINLGFNKYEANAYVALLRNPSSTAYEISKISVVPQSKVYETMKKLVEKGLAVQKGHKPLKYVALPIDEFLNEYKSEIINSIDYLKENIKSITNQPSLEYILHFNNTSQFELKVKELISKAKSSLHLEIWAEEYELLYDDIKSSYDKGIELTIVLYGEVKKELGTIYYHEMDGMLENQAKNGRWLNVLMDNSECCFGILNENDPSGIWTQNKALMLLSQSFISHDILIAEIYKKLRPELNKAFGTNLQTIREAIKFE